MEYELVNAYLEKLSFAEPYTSLDEETRKKVVFSAGEVLSGEFPISKITERASALQVLFMIEGESEQFAMLQRQGATSYSNKGVSVTFNGTDVAPSVLKLLKPAYGTSKKSFGWFV